MPSGLLDFRQHGVIQEPLKFLHLFRKIMKAHRISEDQYLEIMVVHMNNVDEKFFVYKYLQRMEEFNWDHFQNAFVGIFNIQILH